MKKQLSGMYGYGWDHVTQQERDEMLYGIQAAPKPNREQRRKQAKLLSSSKTIKKGHRK